MAAPVKVILMKEPRRRPVREIGIDEKVAFLSTPSAYPEQPGAVEVIETHMSWVFLTDAHAYKLKKPVQYECLDYTSLEARQRNCELEVQLNRRLAPGVYIATVPLTLDAAGAPRVGGDGIVVDWLVKMRRLRSEDTLEYDIQMHRVQKEDVARIAKRMSAFYRERPPEAIHPENYCSLIRAQILENRDALLRSVYGLDRKSIETIAAAQLDFLDRKGELVAQRARSNRIVEGHGDLRPEHIYLGDPPVIVDCLEFHRGFRIVDPASELAFLAMECARLGAPAIEEWLFDVYRMETHDDPPDRLIAFYKCLHACTRAKIAIRHLDGGAVPDTQKWRERTARYLDLASQYGKSLEPEAKGA
jgi:aminoglycoside phosphotransferase family enzyme